MFICIRLAEEHPALVQAASHVAADITKDIGVSARARRPSNSDDDDLMDIDPEVRNCFILYVALVHVHVCVLYFSVSFCLDCVGVHLGVCVCLWVDVCGCVFVDVSVCVQKL